MSKPDGLWKRVWRAITGRTPPVPPSPPSSPAAPPPERLREAGTAGEPIAVPARGEVYDFRVWLEAEWSADAKTREDLRIRSDKQVESVRRAVHDLIWPIGREFLPHRAKEAEIAMAGQMPREFCFKDDTGEIQCTVKLRVRPDPRVIEVLSPFWREYLEMDAKHMLGELRADQVAVLVTHWRDVLNGQTGAELGDAALPFAAQLTEPGFAKVVAALEDYRYKTRRDLVKVLENAAKSHTQVGLFEFAEAYDTALEAFKRSQGLTEGNFSD